jgi:hypothetical protein
MRGLIIGAAAIGVLLAGCSSTQQTSSPSSEEPSASAPAEPSAATADAGDPCTLLTVDDINATLGTSFEPSSPVDDPARQIVTCKYTSADGTQIVDVGVSQTPGADAFKTNQQLAPAYFGGNAKEITVPGADKAYLVIADTYDAPVIGMLVGDTFALVQVGVEGTTPEKGEQLAATVAGRL